jgi:formylglycine-generating enzyme required for sulfatase activity
MRVQPFIHRLIRRWTRATQQESVPNSTNWSDHEIQSAQQDRFNFQDYARVLATRAVTADAPLTIGIFGRWGSGKTSLMRLTQQALPSATNQRGHLYSIWINVWQLSNQDEIWQAFLQALFSSVQRELSLWQRIDKGKLIRQLAINSYRIVLVITPMILGILLAKPSANWDDVLTLLATPIAGAGTLVTIGLGLWAVVKPVIEAAHKTINFDIQTMLKYSPYEAKISELMQLQEQFQAIVTTFVGETGRLVVFIDDLDRCRPDKAIEVLEAIKVFATTRYCVYLLGLDYDIVQQGIQQAYHYESAETAAEYLEKIIQIPFHMPPLDEGGIERFIREYYPDLDRVCATAPDVFARGLDPNPRKVKRALNIYRTLLDLADVRTKAWEMDPVDLELVAKIVVIQNRFRALHDYLVSHPAFLLKVEALTMRGGLTEKGLSKEAEVGLVLLGKSNTQRISLQRGLIQRTDIAVLHDLLRAGVRHFNDDNQRDQIATYIYLTTATENVAERVRPSRREREILLGGNHAQLLAQIDEILGRTTDEPSRQRIGQVYIDRLEGVVGDLDRYTSDERKAARTAVALLQVLLLGEGPAAIHDRLKELFPRYDTMIPSNEAPQVRQAITERIVQRLQPIIDDPLLYSSTHLLTANTALDELEGWELEAFEPQTLRISAGSFLMGSTEQQAQLVTAQGLPKHLVQAELPPHTMYLDSYRIGRYPVTNAEYQAFVRSTKHSPPPHWQGDNVPEGQQIYPVVNVSWDDAVAYCAWLAAQTSKEYYLPSEAEWEKAARGPDSRMYPWGDVWNPTKAVDNREALYRAKPIGQSSPDRDSPYGVADLAVNVWEWTRSLWGTNSESPRFTYPYDPSDGREELKAAGFRVLRGKSLGIKHVTARCGFRSCWLTSMAYDRSPALTSLSGITLWSESRLKQHGIDNIQSLAFAPIAVLVASEERFVVAQIIDWVDQAILLHAIGLVYDTYEPYSALLAYGIRSGTDLVKVVQHPDAHLAELTKLPEETWDLTTSIVESVPNTKIIMQYFQSRTLPKDILLADECPNPGLMLVGFRVAVSSNLNKCG